MGLSKKGGDALKTDRLVAILVMLLRKQRVQAKELAEKFDVSVRTILRDVEAINLAGIPIVTYQGANGGIGIAEGYRLDKSVLTDDEMAAVMTTLKGIDGTLTGKSHEILMEKLKNTLNASQLEQLNAKMRQFVIDLNPWYENTSTKEKLAAIRGAIEASKQLEFTYTDSQGSQTKRDVEPYSLILKAQKWYLYAWCCLRESFRYFKVSRIKALKESGSEFTPREVPAEPAEAEAPRKAIENMVSLELLFNRQVAHVIAEWWDAEAAEDGCLMVKAMLPDNYQTYGFLLSFGNQVEVVSPPHVRTAIGQMAKEIYKKYLPEHDI
jgi:predicted DNA-binding transcriptional regulator YafY